MITFDIVDALSEEDRRQLLGWAADPFDTARFDLEWRPKQFHLIHRQDDLAVSKVSVLRHVISVGDRPLEVGGLGGVITHPEHRHLGYSRQLMARASDFMRTELHLEHALLFCLDRMLPFYEQLTWKPSEETVFFLQGEREIQIATGLNAMTIDFGEVHWPAGAIHLNSLPW